MALDEYSNEENKIKRNSNSSNPLNNNRKVGELVAEKL
jgi:hypothetical protein